MPKKKPTAKKRNQGRTTRGTPKAQYRLTPDTLEQLDRVAAWLSARGGYPVSQADAVRFAARLAAEYVSENPNPEKP